MSSCLMERTLVKVTTDIFVSGEYILDYENGEKRVKITSFDIGEGWFEANDGVRGERYFMKDYGITPVMRDATWKPENNGRRMFLVRD